MIETTRVRHTLWRCAALVFAAALSACLPVTSSSPLGSTSTAATGSGLTGMWRGRFGASADAYITFYPAHDGRMKIILLAPPAAGDEGGWIIFDARAVALGSNTYLDARALDNDGKPPDPRLAHVPVLYRFKSDGSLVLYLIDEAAARTAVRARKIAGTVEPGDFGDVTLTAPPAALDAFFASEAGRALFITPLAVLQRVK